jgi:hypothetical protein
LRNRVELGLKIGAAFEELERGSSSFDTTTLEILPYLALNIPVGRNRKTSAVYFSPSLAVGYSGSFSDSVEIDTFLIEAGAEAKFFVAKDASIDIGLFVTYLSGNGKVKYFVAGFPRKFDLERFSIGPRVTLSIWP